ncbi:unnamed protein product [Calicophoron daubneyi]|uniref:Ras-GEF domain-containing protein n=1 Tax=Calicophoron daubneyi TaxID=300641 RepID=A0AAV2TTQ3_CALDB
MTTSLSPAEHRVSVFSNIPKSGILYDLLDFVTEESNTSVQCSTVDGLLHTYRLFATAEQLLENADRKFWEICHSGTLSVDEKISAINPLRMLLSRWLRQPHVRDFETAAGLVDLHKLTCVVVGWLLVFRTTSRSTTNLTTTIEYNNDGSGSDDWAERYMDDLSVTRPDLNATRCVFYSADRRGVEKLVRKLETVYRNAQYRTESFQTKHASPAPSRPTCEQHSDTSSSCSSSSGFRHRQLSGSSDTRFSRVKGLLCYHVAEELTAIDQRLFLDLLIPECLNYSRGQPCPTLQATMDQFNRVVNVVQFCVLRGDPRSMRTAASQSRERGTPMAVAVWSKRRSHTPDMNGSIEDLTPTVIEDENKRAEIIVLWINIAARLLKLKNLSSLTAVLTALQSNPIHRLQQCWIIVERLYAPQYENYQSMVAVVGMENNYEQLRGEMNKHLGILQEIEHNREKQSLKNRSYACLSTFPEEADQNSNNTGTKFTGMIPYLGLFLRDLHFLDEAMPDYVKSKQKSLRPGSESPYSASRTDKPSSNGTSVMSSSGMLDIRTQPHKSRGNATRLHGAGMSPPTHIGVDMSRDRPEANPRFLGASSPSNQQTSEKLINFEKHLREFAVLKQLFLLQYSANFYRLKSNRRFEDWFYSFPLLTEEEARQYSFDIEPDTESPNFSWTRGNVAVAQWSVWDLFADRASSSLSSGRSRASGTSLQDSSSKLEYRLTDSNSRNRLPPRPTILVDTVFQEPSNTSPETSISSCRSRSPSDYGSVSVNSAPCTNASTNPLPNSNERTITKSPLSGSVIMLSVPQTRGGRSPSADSRKRTQGRRKTDLCVRVTFQGPPQAPKLLKRSAIMKSTPNLSVNGEQPPFDTDNSSEILEEVYTSDLVSDLLTRVLTRFGISVMNINNYDLVYVRPSFPDRILPMRANAYSELSGEQKPTDFDRSGSANPIMTEVMVDCVCVPRVLPRATLHVPVLSQKPPSGRLPLKGKDLVASDFGAKHVSLPRLGKTAWSRPPVSGLFDTNK